MKTKTIILLSLAALCVLALGWSSGRAAQPPVVHSPASPQVQTGGVYNLSWNTIAGGGFIQGGVYTLNSAIGQYDAGATSGSPYTLTGGFYTSIPVNSIYLPAVLVP